MPLYGAGAGDNANDVQTFLDGHFAIVTDEQGTTRIYADDGDGGAPELTTADCAQIGAALAALGA